MTTYTKIDTDLGPHAGRISAPPCVFHDTCGQQATFLAAQSDNAGETAVWLPVCAIHAANWNVGSDWDAPVYELIPAPNVGGFYR